MKTLFEILALRRPHGGKNERFVVEGIILPRLPTLEVYCDATNNPMAYTCEIGKGSKTLFVAHADTVHRDELTPNPLVYDENKKLIYKTDGTPLGADDGAGVWLLLKMAEAGVPGTYLWTLGEESGGIGARWLADNAPEWLATFDKAISFDRKGTTSVITHQGCGGRCCSDEFALCLAGELTTMPYQFIPDSGGVYTDTAEFTTLISECTNISIGYANEHSGNETLDVGFLESLLKTCIDVKWEDLPTKRDPSEIESWGADRYIGVPSMTFEDLYTMTAADIKDLCWDDPEVVADLLIDLVGQNPCEYEGVVKQKGGAFIDEQWDYYRGDD